MAKTTTVTKQLIPYQSGVTVLTPIDQNKKPDYKHSVMTAPGFITSTQISETRTMETLENGSGQDKSFVTDVVYNYNLTVNALNIVFHNTLAGRIETLPDSVNVPDVVTVNLPEADEEDADSTLAITFGTGKMIENDPAPDEDGNYDFVVEDSYGNPLVRMDTPQFGAYSYDKDTKELQFSEEYAGASIRVKYEYASSNSIKYVSNPILSQPEFQVDTFGIVSDAETNRKFRVHERLLRATQSGDLSGLTMQKSRSAPITYTMQSAPVPDGVSVYSVTYTPIDDDTSDSYIENYVNGGDDKFTTVTEP